MHKLISINPKTFPGGRKELMRQVQLVDAETLSTVVAASLPSITTEADNDTLLAVAFGRIAYHATNKDNPDSYFKTLKALADKIFNNKLKEQFQGQLTRILNVHDRMIKYQEFVKNR